MGKKMGKERDLGLYPLRKSSRSTLLLKIIIFIVLPVLFVSGIKIYYNSSASADQLKHILKINKYYTFAFKGDLKGISQILNISEDKVASLRLYVNRVDELTYILTDKNLLIATINNKNSGLKFNKEGLTGLSPNLAELLLKNNDRNDFYQKIFGGKYVSVTGVTKATKTTPRITINNKALYLETDLNTVLAISNLDILIYSLEIVTNQKISYTGKERVLLKVDNENVTAKLDSLGFPNLTIVGSKSERIYFKDSSAEINKFTQTNNKVALDTVKNFINLLSDATNQIALIENTTLSPAILMKAYNELTKDSVLTYSSTDSEIKISYLNVCRIVGVSNQILYVNYC